MDDQFGTLLHFALNWRSQQESPIQQVVKHTYLLPPLSVNAYRSFLSAFEAMEAPFFRKETTLLMPPVHLREHVVREKFVANEHIYREALTKSGDTAVRKDTVQTTNLPLTPAPEGDTPSDKAIRHGPLTFDPRPPESKREDTTLAAANMQAELMRWHYRLGHLSFSKLKQLAINGEIFKNLLSVPAPKCAGCLFGVMTKLLWHRKSPNLLTKSSLQPSRGRRSQSTK